MTAWREGGEGSDDVWCHINQAHVARHSKCHEIFTSVRELEIGHRLTSIDALKVTPSAQYTAARRKSYPRSSLKLYPTSAARPLTPPLSARQPPPNTFLIRSRLDQAERTFQRHSATSYLIALQSTAAHQERLPRDQFQLPWHLLRSEEIKRTRCDVADTDETVIRLYEIFLLR